MSLNLAVKPGGTYLLILINFFLSAKDTKSLLIAERLKWCFLKCAQFGTITSKHQVLPRITPSLPSLLRTLQPRLLDKELDAQL